MAKDVSDMMRDTVSHVVRDVTQSMSSNGKGRRSSNGPLSGARGVAAGAGLAALAPLAAKGAAKAARGRLASGAAKNVAKKPGKAVGSATSKLGDSIGKGVGEKVKEKVDESGGVAGVAKEAGKGMLPFGGGDSGGGAQQGAPGVGKGRRMPVQQSMDVAVPIETCYNQWTQFEDWPLFMHRVTRVTQEDPCTVSFATKIWAKTKEFTAKIETQRPEQRIKWRVEQGITHTGVVTFHELAPQLTRVELTVDVDPGSLLEKAARGMRHIKRAMRADLHRFKAFIEMQELESGAWRGVIEEGELVEDHDDSYDEERDYADVDDLRSSGEEDEDESAEDEDEDEPTDEVDADEDPEASSDEEDPEDPRDEDARPARKRPSERGARASSSRSRGKRSSSNGRSSGNGRSSSRSGQGGRRKTSAGRS